MLKKIALTALFAITFAVGIGAAQAKTTSAASKTAPRPPAPQFLCGWGMVC